MKVEVLDGADAAALRGAELIAEAAREAVGERGGFALAASGGRGPWRMFELLGAEEVPWRQVDVFQVDERVAPDGDEDRNLTHLLAHLPEPVRERVHPMPVADHDLDDAAARYAAELPASLDLIHLGIGPDGHTASLVPGDEVLEVTDRRVSLTASEYQGRRRMTLTYPELARAGRLLWLVTGAEKREALKLLRDGDQSIPAGRVASERAIVIADAEAAGLKA